MQAHPLIDWADAGTEFAGFIASFLAIGAIGFRFAVLRRRFPEEGHFHRRAAVIGLIGTIITAIFTAVNLPQAAARAHKSVGALLTSNALAIEQVAGVALALLGFVLVLAGIRAGWWPSLIGVVGGTLRISPPWVRMINPMHRLGGGFWIGTLFVLVVAGLLPLLSENIPPERRGALAADMVNAFSPLALGSAFVLVIFGVWTAVRHLKYVAALWTTPYGYALIAKLCFVLGVAALGAWNWRRQRPMLGSEDAAHALRRSASTELAVALCVLIVTAILVSLPAPRALRAGNSLSAPTHRVRPQR